MKNKSVDSLTEWIVDHQIDPNVMKDGEAVIHNFATWAKYDHLLALLLYCRQPYVDINIAMVKKDGDKNDGNTALHIAIEVC